MNEPFKKIDANGNALIEGDRVMFKNAPEKLIHGLPLEDQTAIQAQAGKRMEIMGFDSYGHAEMDFTSADGVMHKIWVEPKELFKLNT